MDFERIFWLDDYPIFLPWLQRGLHPGFSELMQRTTLAFDTNEGAEIVADQEFDLYVLDADVPDVSGPDKNWLGRFVADLVEGQRVEIRDYVGHPGSGCDDFVAFYFDHLKGKIPEGAKVVVCSVAQAAQSSAYSVGLPFYVKGVGRKHGIERNVWHDIRKRFFSGPVRDAFADGHLGEDFYTRIVDAGEDGVKAWEKGDLDDLVHKYLL
ncbi:hypothetical protein HOC80_03900 [archaeon]|jgi:hypothetical protein|nr:hypothetical protein [archaeon]MBT4417220.1 hypothetical protein [archaeon]